MGILGKIGLKLFGKKIVENGVEKTGLSKTKITALVFVAITGIESISAAWGNPIVIPTEWKQALAAAGIWSLRDSLK